MSTLKAKQDQIRQQLNLKNLQRHDPSISEIVTSASYASVYENFGEQWVKTGVEGPMFLFSRSKAPHYGFFVLNRQGLEYVQEFLTPDCELNVGGEFILFEGSRDVDKATGIWIFDESERASLCKRMEQLRSAAAAVASSTKASSTLPSTKLPLAVGQSVSLDMLFASPSTSASSPSIRAASSPLHQSAPTNPLDLLFLNAAAKSSPQQQPRQPPPPTIQSSSQPTIPSSSATPASAIPKTLEQLFAAASPVPQSATLPFQALSQAHLSAPSPSLLPNSLPQGNKSREGPSAARSKEEHRGMSLLDSIFASAQTNGSHSDSSRLEVPQSQLSTPTSKPSPPTAPSESVRSATTITTAPTSSSSSSADARALLAMLGHPAGLEASTSSPPAPAQPKTSEVEQKPRFAAPLLSHDVFANFPLPSKHDKEPPVSVAYSERPVEEQTNGKKDRKEEKIEEEETAVTETLSQVHDSLADILKTAPVPLPSLAPSRSALEQEEAKRAISSSPRLQLSNAQVIDLVDSTFTSQESDGHHNEKEAMDREQFMQKVFSLLQKPSVQMQLYGRYLERVEELH